MRKLEAPARNRRPVLKPDVLEKILVVPGGKQGSSRFGNGVWTINPRQKGFHFDTVIFVSLVIVAVFVMGSQKQARQRTQFIDCVNCILPLDISVFMRNKTKNNEYLSNRHTGTPLSSIGFLEQSQRERHTHLQATIVA